MHPNPAFRRTEHAAARAFAAERGFGVLAVNGEAAPMTAHVPFVLKGDTALLHLVASNPLWRLLQDGARPALLSVAGPDAYISPDWYGLDDQVPTWNYVAVNLRGKLEARPQTELPDTLDALSALFEARLAPKPPWTMAKMSDDARDRMLRQIRPARLQIDEIESTFKLGQNKPADARLGAAGALSQTPGAGLDPAALAQAMKDVP